MDHKNVDMMGSFYGTKAMKLVKSEFFMNPYKKLSAIVEKKEAEKKRLEEIGYEPSEYNSPRNR